MPTAWRTQLPNSALLLDLGPSAEPIVRGLAGPDAPGAFATPHAYALTDARGNTLTRYDALTWAFDDEIGATVYDIHNGAFRRLTVTHSGEEPTVRHQVTALLESLTPAPEINLPA